MIFLTVLQFGKPKIKAPGDTVCVRFCTFLPSHQAEGAEETNTVSTGQETWKSREGGPDESPLTPLERTSIS